MLLAVAVVVGVAPAQEPDVHALQNRITRLEQQVRDLLNENLRLRRLEDRVGELEIATGRSGWTRGDGAEGEATQPMPSMPYDEDLMFVVRSATVRGTAAHAIARAYRVDVLLWEIPPADRDALIRADGEGGQLIGFSKDDPGRRRLYALTLEDLTENEARRWREALEPKTLEMAGLERMLHRQIAFARVPTDLTFRDGYEGNSGAVRIWRGQVYWHENKVFFLENGVLRIRGSAGARFHLKFVPSVR
jgi:hypothetical protein